MLCFLSRLTRSDNKAAALNVNSGKLPAINTITKFWWRGIFWWPYNKSLSIMGHFVSSLFRASVESFLTRHHPDTIEGNRVEVTNRLTCSTSIASLFPDERAFSFSDLADWLASAQQTLNRKIRLATLNSNQPRIWGKFPSSGRREGINLNKFHSQHKYNRQLLSHWGKM